MPRPPTGSPRSQPPDASLRAGGVSVHALRSARGPRLALRLPDRETRVLSQAPGGAPHGYVDQAGTEEEIALSGTPLDGSQLASFVSVLAGGALGTPGIDVLAQRAGASPDEAASLRAAIEGMLETAGFPDEFRAGLAAVGRLAFTSAEQRRRLFADGEAGALLRRACREHPYLCHAHWADAVLAVDTGRDPTEAVVRASGLPPAVLRRIRTVPALDFVTADLCPSPAYLRELLVAVPPDWLPTSRAERLAFSQLADALAHLAHHTGTPLGRLVGGCKGDWTGLLSGLTRAAVRDGGPPAPLSRLLSDSLDFPRHFADKVVAPLMARSGAATPAAARAVATAGLYGGRSALSILEMSARWHARQDRLDASLPDLVCPDTPWPALAEARDLGGLRIVPLTTGRDLVEEGAPGPDRTGADGLCHCVGSYRGRARTGECHILSVRRPLDGGRYVRIATAEVVVGADGIPDLRQLLGRRNAEPPPEASAAMAAYLARRFDPPAPRAAPDADAITKRAGYDWRDEDAVAAAVAAFQPVLPGDLRGLAPDALRTALGVPSAPRPESAVPGP